MSNNEICDNPDYLTGDQMAVQEQGNQQLKSGPGMMMNPQGMQGNNQPGMGMGMQPGMGMGMQP